MRQFFPDPIDAVDPLEVYRDLPVAEGRPAVRLTMIAAVDGATAVDGLSGGLGGPADRRVFAALRSLADVVLVAAGTVRAETYGPAKLPIAVVSGSLRLTVAPRLVSGDAKRIVTGPPLAPPPELTLRTVCEEDGYLFLRYRFPGR